MTVVVIIADLVAWLERALNDYPRKLRKFLRDVTDHSLATIDTAMKDGKVQLRVGGHFKESLSDETLVFPGDEVFLEGALLQTENTCRVFLLNKPKRVTTTARDPKGKQDLSAWLKRLPQGFFPVGRLDRATTGALLLTNSGDLATALLRPEHHVDKLYWLFVAEEVTPEDPRLGEWRSGMNILGGGAQAESIEVLHHTAHYAELHVVLREGKNRQIRRMCRLSDFHLLHLHRKAVGDVHLGELGSGEMRELAQEEVETLWGRAGGREEVRRRQLEALERRAQGARAAGSPDERLEEWLSGHQGG